MRFVSANIEFRFDEYNKNSKEEFDRLGLETDDPIGQFIKLAKARGDTKDTDPILLELLVALHRKIDDLTAYLKNEEKKLLNLPNLVNIIGIGFEYFKIDKDILIKGKKYYGRMDLPVFPKREVPLIFEGYNQNIGKILFMHERDEKDYNSYITARERAIIRELKSKNG